MFRYKYVGEDGPRSMPEYAVDNVVNGDIVEVPEELNSPFFVKVAAKSEAKTEAKAEPRPEVKAPDAPKQENK